MKSFKTFVTEAITQKDHIKNYTDLSRPLTRKLYSLHKEGKSPPSDGRKVPTMELGDQKFDINALDSIASKNKISKNTELYSGVKYHPLESANENGVLHLPAYTSTSERHSVAKKFAHTQARRQDRPEDDHKQDAHIIRFNLKKGDRAGNISSKSSYGADHEFDEREWLLPRNTRVKIHPEPETSTDKEGRKFHIWNAHTTDE